MIAAGIALVLTPAGLVTLAIIALVAAFAWVLVTFNDFKAAWIVGWNAMANHMARAINGMIAGINWLLSGLNKLTGQNWAIPSISYIGQGTGGQVPEVAMPLSGMGRDTSNATVNVTVNGWVGSDQQIASRVHEELLRMKGRNYDLGLAT